MQWENLTATDFKKAVHDTGVCVVALGVVEKHSEHLPLGTDYLNGHAVACLAAERESAVVFPPFYFGQIYEARCFPGTITIRPTLLIELLLGVLDEIGRNGFKKIILYNAHGGNEYFLSFLAQSQLWEQKPYCVYFPKESLTPEGEEEYVALRETDYGWHAGERETDLTISLFPHLVKIDCVPDEPAKPLHRMSHLPPTFTGVWWYSDHPDHYSGDARPSVEAKGHKLVELLIDFLAGYIAAIKRDEVVPTLQEEFYQRVSQMGKAS